MFRRLLKRLLKLLLVGYVAFTAASVGAIVWFWYVTPDPSVLRTAEPQTTSFIQNRCASGEPGCNVDWTPLSRMSPFVPQAVILAEDIRFFRHAGLDFRSLWAALKVNWKSGKVVWGGSTLTQQLAKNLYLGSEKTAGRKLREIAVTLKLERRLPKERILEIYLNVAQWGPNLYGITNASRHFFGKTPAELGPLEASYLASILPNPEHADEPAWKDKFTNVGGRLFEALVQSYLPPFRVTPQDVLKNCPEFLDAESVRENDYIVAKIFSTFSNEILSGRAALVSAKQLKAVLSEKENDFVSGLWDRVRKLRDVHAVSCRREDGPSEDQFAAVGQPSALYGRRTYFIPLAAEGGVSSLLIGSREDGHPLIVTSAYRGAGYQTYLFLATLRQNGYCLSRTAREVALPEESEHSCLDTPAVDFGTIAEEGAFETTKAFAYLAAHGNQEGFLMSYPEGNSAGILYEPWHWKWMGKN
jgi:monofunctional biosynthetic peptidoglycan transglycosylase